MRRGLAWIKVNEVAKGRDGLQSPIVKNLHDAAIAAIVERTGAQDGDIIFFAADRAKVVNDSLGALRLKIGHSEFGTEKGLSEQAWRPLWVIDFPMFEYDEENSRWVAAHHPFTSPKDEHVDYLEGRSGPLPREGVRHGAQRLGRSAAGRCGSTVKRCRARYSAR